MPTSKIAVAIALATTLAAFAGCNSQPPPEQVGPYISCHGTDAAAVVAVPEPLDRWSQISCTKFGHVIEAAQDWRWTRSNSNATVVLSSQFADTLLELGNSVYWQSVTVEPVVDDEAAAIIDRYEQDVAPFANPLLVQAWKLSASNYENDTQIAYFLVDDGKPSAYLCDAGCETGMPIHITKQLR